MSMTKATPVKSNMSVASLSEDEAQALLERHRVELTAYCYRMLGSGFEAEDAVQETMLRAWRNLGRFEGRSAMRTWLFRIATNICLDMLKGSQRRARPMDLRAPGVADDALGDRLAEQHWVFPFPTSRILPEDGDPADVAAARESVRLAFLAALQNLPPRQRASLILCEVLDWKASEAAELLDTSVASVNSALQRARATLQSRQPSGASGAVVIERDERKLLDRYVEAFEQYDMEKLTGLLREDATWSMPPYPLWLRGHVDVAAFCTGTGSACEGSVLVPTSANGATAFAQYKPDGRGGHEAWSLQVLEIAGDKIAGVCFFLDTARLFPLFDLPLRLER
jgi:RNA polymerase sigma-70 factor (ECF subfamily)